MKTLITINQKDLKNMIFQNGALERLEQISEVDWIPENEEYTSLELAKDIGAYDACITGWGSPKFTCEVIENAARLKFVGHTAGTVVPIVDPLIFDKNIKVVNANSALARTTAEASVTLMMAGAWNLCGYNLQLKEGEWSKNSSQTVMGLYGQTVGLIGYGDISREVIRLIKPFNVKILLNSRYCSKEEADSLGIELCSLEELLKKSQIISLHNTLTPSTQGMLGKKELDLIRDGALLVNTARGPIIDEQALIATLQTGRLFAAIDVYHNEPLDKESDLLKLPNVLCVPHIGGFGSYWKTRLGLTIVNDLERFIKGEPLEGEITKEKFSRLTPR